MAGSQKLEFDILANDKASTTLSKVSRGAKEIGGDLDKASDKGSAALKKLGTSAEKAKESLGKVGEGAKEGLGKLTETFKAGPLAWVGLGAGIGALVLDGFSQAMENQDATHLLTAQLGASDAEMSKLGKISGDLYKDAFGESVSEVSQVMKTVFQSGLATVKDSEDAIKGVTTQVMNYSKISGEEALPVTRAISQMLKTGLAKNATEAFDLLTRGVQKGLDKSEDLLDTVNEYGTQFRKLGLTGTQAFGLISQAIQGGARDSDVAADAIKEFSIRAVDGSTSTAAGFKGLGLSAKAMAETIAQGGPKAAAALDLTLDRLRGIKDPAKQAQLAVMLFGTQAEDLGKALYSMDLSSASKEFGQVAGAAERAGDVINDTASNKLATVGRTIKMSIVDAIGKYALPKLEEFADWFNGPGKMVMVGWALDGSQAMLAFGDTVLGATQKIIPALAKVGAVSLVAAAGLVAMNNPAKALDLLKQAKDMDEWGKSAQENLGNARKELQGWSTTLGKAKTKVQLQADIEDLDQKLAKAQKQLRDPGLTKERRAQLTADITRLTRAKDEALRKLGDPNLIKVRTAKLDADKRNLDTKISQARAALADPKLTATKRAKLDADIRSLLAQKAKAQAAIDSLKGKTVPLVIKYTTTGVNLTTPSSVGRRASGGPVTKGMPYVVGEKRPELFVPDQNGTIVPQVPKAKGAAYAGGSGGTTINVYVSGALDSSDAADKIVNKLRKFVRFNAGGDVQAALGR